MSRRIGDSFNQLRKFSPSEIDDVERAQRRMEKKFEDMVK
jgi:hypothetical protein